MQIRPRQDNSSRSKGVNLGKSQSERIVWLCEELGIQYELKHYTRDPVTILSPPEL